MKATLDRAYFWDRQVWGPGESEIPETLAIALGLMALPTVPAAPPPEVTVTISDPVAAFAKVQQPSKATRRKGA